MAYEEKSVPSSAKGPSITCSHAVCQGGGMRQRPGLPGELTCGRSTGSYERDFAGQKSKYRSWDSAGLFRRIGDPFGRHHSARPRGLMWAISGEIGEFMRRRVLELRNAVLRQFAATLAVSSLVIPIGLSGASAQSGTPRRTKASRLRRSQPMRPRMRPRTSAAPTSSRKRRKSSTARPATPNASGSAGAWCG